MRRKIQFCNHDREVKNRLIETSKKEKVRDVFEESLSTENGINQQFLVFS